jgi:hypothetical protein|tara:strand:+ start:92 stop:322 length:231 start_codon:yes stop_codon:yes gene_type:complete
MEKRSYNSQLATKNGYKDQLIHYYNKGIGERSEIADVVITKDLISIIEKRYKQLGGILPISKLDITKQKGKRWKLI